MVKIRERLKSGKFITRDFTPTMGRAARNNSRGSSGTQRTVPHDFVGPLRPGTIRLPAPIQGPTRPDTDVEKFRRTGRSSRSSGGRGSKRTVSVDFIGPLRPGTTRDKPIQGPTRPGTDVKEFRKTGRSVKSTGRGESKSSIEEKARTMKFGSAGKLFSTAFKGQSGRIFTPLSEQEQRRKQAQRELQKRFVSFADKKAQEGLEFHQKQIAALAGKKPFGKFVEGVGVPVAIPVVKKGAKKSQEALDFYEKSVIKRLRRTFPSLGETQIGQIAKAKRIIDKKKPGEKVLIGLPGQRKYVDVAEFQKLGLVEFGKKVYRSEVEKTFTDIARKSGIKSPELVGKGVAFGSELSAYLIPGVYGGEVAARAAEAQLLKGKLGGSKSAIQFAKEHPFETGLAGVSGAAAVITRKSGAARTLERVSQKPVEKSIKLKAVLKREKETRAQFIKEERLRIEQGDKFLKIVPKKKGSLALDIKVPTGEFKGTVSETLRTGLLGRKKTFTGKAGLSKGGRYREELDLGRGLKRITTVSKDGKTTIKLVKNGKVLSELKAGDTLGETLKLQALKSKKKMQKEMFGTGTRTETKGIDILTGRPKTQIKKKGQLESTLIAAERKAAVRFGKDKKGLSMKIEEVEEIIDISKVGPRRGTVSLKIDKRSAVKKEARAQRIEFDKGKKQYEADITKFIRTGKTEALQKLEQARIKRAIKIRARQTIDIRYVDPKVLKKSKALIKKQKKGLKKEEATYKKLFKIGKQEKGKRDTANFIRNIDKRVREQNIKAGRRTVMIKELAKDTTLRGTTFIKKARDIVKPIKFKTPKVPVVLGAGKKASKSLSKRAMGLTSAEALRRALGTKTKMDSMMDTVTITKIDSMKDTATGIDTATITKTTTRTSLKPETIKRTAMSTRKIPKFTPPRIPTKPKPVIFPTKTKRSKKKIATKKSTSKNQYWTPEAKRNNKWVKLSQVGMRESSARGRGARAVDNTIAGRFRIVKADSGSDKVVDNYFAFNKKKFRDYKIVKGKRVPIKNTWIERRGPARLDSAGERNQITIAKLIKKNDWLGRNKRRRKSTKRRV